MILQLDTTKFVSWLIIDILGVKLVLNFVCCQLMKIFVILSKKPIVLILVVMEMEFEEN